MAWGPYYAQLPLKSIFTTGTIFSIAVLSGGSGYPASSTTIPITITYTSGSGAAATATSNASGIITSVQVSAPGSAILSAPASITAGGGGSGATFQANTLSFVDQPHWDEIINNFVVWQGNVNGGAFTLSNVNINFSSGQGISGPMKLSSGASIGRPAAPISCSAGTNNNVVATGENLWFQSPGAFTVTGIAMSGVQDGQEIIIYNDSTVTLTLAHDSTLSAVGNRFFCPYAESVILPNFSTARAWYDISNGLWHIYGAMTVIPFQALSLLNSWVNSSGWTAGYMMDINGRVYLRGQIASGTVTGGTHLTTLPAGFAPPQAHSFVCKNSNAGRSALISVDTSGNVYIDTGSLTVDPGYLSLDSISFSTF